MADIMIPAWVDGTLAPVEKLEAHVRGLRHKAVSVFIVQGRRLLLQQRAMTKYHTPGLWANTCCTHPAWGENALDCAVRRLNEELGITGLLPEYRHQLEYRADVGNGLIEHELVDVFLVQVKEPVAHVANPDEVMATRWVEIDDLVLDVAQNPEVYTPWLKIYLNDYSKAIFGTDLLG